MARKAKGAPGRPGTVSGHPRLDEIRRDLIEQSGDSKRFRNLAIKYGVNHLALRRYENDHLTPSVRKTIVKHAELVAETKDLDVLATLGGIAGQMTRYFDAADRWLQDPDDPTRYSLAPRETEVLVIWEEEIPKDSGDGFRTVKRKERLTDLLKRCGLKGGPGVEEILMVELNTGNPRKLFLDGVTAGKPLYELLGKALGQIKPDAGTTVNVLVSSQEFRQHVERVVQIVGPCERCRVALMQEMGGAK